MKKKKLMVAAVTVFMLMLFTIPAIAGGEQILIDLGADLLASLFKGKQSSNEKGSVEQILTSNVRKTLLQKGEVQTVKLEGMVTFGKKIHVAFFSTKVSGKDGCYYYLAETGLSVIGDTSEDMGDYKKFLSMMIPQKRIFLREYFEKYADFSIPLAPEEEKPIAEASPPTAVKTTSSRGGGGGGGVKIPSGFPGFMGR